MRKLDNDELIVELKNLAGRLGKKSLSKAEVSTSSLSCSISCLRYRFGSFGKALEAAGLQTVSSEDKLGRNIITDNDLFSALHEFQVAHGREPTYSECNSPACRYSTRPYNKRFGGWSEVIQHYRKWKQHINTASNGVDSLDEEVSECRTEPILTDNGAVSATKTNAKKQQLYGEPINFRGLRHAPINEQGVVFLFGMISHELGFLVENVQQAFPDCEAKRCVDIKGGKWAKVTIEFEYKSSNFRQHGHNINGCDVIVCWDHDWLECPIEVVGLKDSIKKLPQYLNVK